MYTLDFDKPLLGSDGKVKKEPNQTGELIDLHLGELLAGMLERQRKPASKMKFLVWAIALQRHEPLQMDKADYAVLKKVIDEDELAHAIFLARCAEVMEEAKDE